MDLQFVVFLLQPIHSVHSDRLKRPYLEHDAVIVTLLNEGYTPEDFIKGKERSILRNPLIAETLYKSKEIEKWGSGLKRIYEECRLNDVKVEFETLKSGFLVVFYRNPAMTKIESIPEDGGISEGISEGIKSLLVYIGNSPGMRIKVIAHGINRPAKTIERWIKKLREEGRIDFIGSKKTGGYYLAGTDSAHDTDRGEKSGYRREILTSKVKKVAGKTKRR